MRFTVATHADIFRLTLLLTALTVAVPVAVVAGALWPIHISMPDIFWGAVKIAALIPLFITPPIALGVLHMLKLLTETIARIDDHVKFDALTGVFNRGHFLDRVRASRSDGMILIIDADHFKAINDTHGHDAGDEALKMLSGVMMGAVGEEGLVGRLGGEEFAVFLPGIEPEEGEVVAQRICQKVRERRFLIGETLLRITVSIGGARHSENTPIGHTLKIADALLYEAKQAGRDCYIGRGKRTAEAPLKLARAL